MAKIVYIYSSLANKGGTEHILIQKMNRLAEDYGNDVFIITNEQNHEPIAFPLSSKVKHLDIDVQIWKKYNYFFPIRLFIENRYKKTYRKKLLEQLYELQPDVIICCHTFLPHLICALPVPCKKVIEAHNPRNVYVDNLCHSLSSLYERLQWRYFLMKAEKECDVVVCLTNGDANNWKYAKKVEVIPDLVKPLNQYDYDVKSKKVVSLGRLVYQKGYDLLIDAWSIVHKKHPDWELDIYGEGLLYDLLSDRIRQKGLEDVITLYPFVRDVEKVLANSSFLVCSSRFEGFGMTLVESMMVGRPCVSFNCPYGPSEIVTHGNDGLLAENGNIDELARMINRMIENEDERVLMAKNAVKTSGHFHPSVIMPKWIDLFKNP